MKKKNAVLIILAALLLAAAGIRKADAVAQNIDFRRNFPYLDSYTESEFQRETGYNSVRTIDSEYMDFIQDSTIINYEYYIEPLDTVMTLENAIGFYELVDSEYVLAFEYPSGTQIRLLDVSMRGLTASFPTYEKGWRFMKRPLLVGEEEDLGDPYDNEVYFVKTAELERIASQAYGETKEHWRSDSNFMNMVLTSYIDGFDVSELSDSQMEKLLLFRQDVTMYVLGTYLSPDLYEPVFDAVNIVLLSLAGALLIVFVGLSIYHKTKSGTTQKPKEP